MVGILCLSSSVNVHAETDSVTVGAVSLDTEAKFLVTLNNSELLIFATCISY